MPVPTKKLVSDFNRKKSKSNSTQDFDVVDIVAYLNEAQEMYLDNIINLSESNKRYSSILRKLEKKKVKLSCKEIDEDCCFVEYPEDLYKRNSISVKACKEGCEGDKTFPVYNVNTDDEGESLRDPYRNADYSYEQVFGDEAGEGYYIYHQGNMDIKEVYINYFKKPNELHAPSLVKCEGDEFYYDYCGEKITEDTNLEFGNSFVSNTIVNMAVLLATTDSKDIPALQAQLNTIINLTKII